MYFHISFNTWLNHTRREAKRERHCIKQENMRTKAIKANKPFIPTVYEEAEELLVDISIEVDLTVYYTSEEDDLSELSIDLNSPESMEIN